MLNRLNSRAEVHQLSSVKRSISKSSRDLETFDFGLL